ARGDAIEDGRRLRRLDADLLELLEMPLQRNLVAAGPAGDDELGDLVVAHGQMRYFLPTAEGTSSSPNSRAITLNARQPVQWPGARSVKPNFLRSATDCG